MVELIFGQCFRDFHDYVITMYFITSTVLTSSKTLGRTELGPSRYPLGVLDGNVVMWINYATPQHQLAYCAVKLTLRMICPCPKLYSTLSATAHCHFLIRHIFSYITYHLLQFLLLQVQLLV